MVQYKNLKICRRYKCCFFILIGLCIGNLMNGLRSLHPCPSLNGNHKTRLINLRQNRASSPMFFQIDLHKLPYQLDYPLNFNRTPEYGRLPKPPCRSFGEWIKKRCRSGLNQNYVDYTLFDFLDLFNSTEEYSQSENRYIINGGANDGLSSDPLYPLFDRLKYPGIAIELSEELFTQLKTNLPAQNIVKLNVALEPHTVYQLFIDNKVPFRPFIMKMDIDGYDYTVMRSIFIHNSNNSRTQFEPAIVLVEMNEKFPPPIHFYTRYRSYYGYKGDHFYGASITAWTYLFSFQLGYVLLGTYDWNNLIFIRYDLAKDFNLLYQFPHNSYDVWLHGYWNRPDKDKHFPWNVNVKHWNSENETVLVKYRHIQNYLHSSKTFTENVQCSYFMDVQTIYTEPE